MNYSNPELVGNMTAAQQQAQTANLLATVEVGEAAYEAGYWKRRALNAERDFAEAIKQRNEFMVQLDAWIAVLRRIIGTTRCTYTKEELNAAMQIEKARILKGE